MGEGNLYRTRDSSAALFPVCDHPFQQPALHFLVVRTFDTLEEVFKKGKFKKILLLSRNPLLFKERILCALIGYKTYIFTVPSDPILLFGGSSLSFNSLYLTPSISSTLYFEKSQGNCILSISGLLSRWTTWEISEFLKQQI